MLLLIGASVWFGWQFHKAYGMQHQQICQANQNAGIPTVEDIQRLVGCEKIDGKIGPETLAKWDRAICDQYATQYLGPQIAQKPEAGK